MKIYNKRKDVVYFLSNGIATEISPDNFIEPALKSPMDQIHIVDKKRKKIFDMELPTDVDLKVFSDRVVFDNSITFKSKSYLLWIIAVLFILSCIAIYFIPFQIK